jgi:hypothetical protein
MIRCWLNSFALTRHLEEGAEISENLRAHLASCETCRATALAQREVISMLSVEIPSVAEPPFLKARILNAVKATQPSRRPPLWPAWGLAAAVVVVPIFLLPRREAKVATAEWKFPKLEATSGIKAVAAPLPIETEFENLKADTRNAARALAANFLPSQP